jgi:hypothetical protein
MTTPPNTGALTVQELADGINELTYQVLPDTALEALVSCIDNQVDRCAEPMHAILAVISEITDLVNTHSGRAAGDREWVINAWTHAEPCEVIPFKPTLVEAEPIKA